MLACTVSVARNENWVYAASQLRRTGQGAQRSDEHPNVCFRGHVAIADGRHGNDGPPKADRDRGEVVVRVVLDAFGVEDERGEDDDSDDQEEDE